MKPSPDQDQMDPQHLFADGRLRGFCVFCGDDPSTADHVPARIFLDEPHPEGARVVDACEKCNTEASLDEQYVACLIECVLCGSTDPNDLQRAKVRRTLAHAPDLGRRIARGRSRDLFNALNWTFERERVERVAVKLARGLVAYEESNPQLAEPERVWIAPLLALDASQRAEFEAATPPGVSHRWPEVGSRAFIRAYKNPEADPWVVVQPERFRYHVDDTEIRMVVREYLACVVAWA